MLFPCGYICLYPCGFNASFPHLKKKETPIGGISLQFSMKEWILKHKSGSGKPTGSGCLHIVALVQVHESHTVAGIETETFEIER